MGLSASQGRMLLLTARKDDLEFRAQQISQRRLILSQQLEKISNDYEDATSNRQMKMTLYQEQADGTKISKSLNLTYSALVSGSVGNNSKYSGIKGAREAGTENPEFTTNNAMRLVNTDGYIVVSHLNEIIDTYEERNQQDLGVESEFESKKTNVDSNGHVLDANGNAKEELLLGNYLKYSQELNNAKNVSYQTDGKYIKISGRDQKGAIFEKLFNAKDNKEVVAEMGEDGKRITFDENNAATIIPNESNGKYTFTKEVTLVRNRNSEILEPDNEGVYTVEINGKEFHYIVDPALTSDKTDGYGEITAPTYIQDCLRNGKYRIEQGSTSADTGNFEWHSLSWDSSSAINDQYYTDDDASAKAKYDRLQNEIQNQDKKLELELNNIETQRSAVTTEIESVQKVMDDNIESTFKMFS